MKQKSSWAYFISVHTLYINTLKLFLKNKDDVPGIWDDIRREIGNCNFSNNIGNRTHIHTPHKFQVLRSNNQLFY